MDQVKEILRQAIKYRFWIAVGISLLFPAIAYVLGSGPVQEQAKAQTTAIEGAKKDVDQYASGDVKNGQYKPIIDKKTAEVSKEVRKSWQKLYDRQAPLLTWPERVQERFRNWGRKWPEDEDASRVQFAIIDYVQSYPKYVTEVYESFHPFNYEDGSGIVAAPPESVLLKPAPFKETQLPDLGKVWAAQERLWVQRSLLEVIAEVNKNAKDWDTGIIKAIKALEVGTQNSQDQVSMVDGKTLVEAEPITDPKAPPPAAAAESSAPAGMEGMMAMMSSSGGGTQKDESVFYLATEGADAAKYKIMPVEMAVLIDQERIQDFLAALENSPMAIQVKEFAMSRPTERVTKPEKGDSQSGYGFFGSGTDMRSMMTGMRMSGFGGMGGMMNNMMRSRGGYAGAMSGYGPAAATKSGVDKRSLDRRKKSQEEAEKEKEQGKTKRQSLHDPYFNIVEVTVYGQVRFYNPPPPEEPSAEEPASPGETPAPAAEGEAKKEGEPSKTGGDMPAAKEGEAPAAKDEAAAKEKEKGDEAAPKDEAKPAESDAAKKDDAAKEKAPEEPAKGKDADAPKSDEGETKSSDDSAPAKK